MEHIEMVERLKEKADVTYEEAKAALEASNWDMLDAVILLEKDSKIKQGTGEYSTKKKEHKKEKHYDMPKDTVGIGDVLMKFGRWIGKLIQMGNRNSINADKNGERMISLPVTAFVLLLIVGFWGVLPIMVVGLFCGFSYSFSGPDLGRDDVNDVIGKATKVADNIKDEFKEAKDAKDRQKEDQEENQKEGQKDEQSDTQ